MARQYPASKTQIRKLTELGVEAPRGYSDAADLLEARGWDASGSTQIWDADSEDRRINDREFDR